MNASNVHIFLTIGANDFSVDRDLDGKVSIGIRKVSPYRAITGSMILPLDTDETLKYADEVGILCRVLKAAEEASRLTVTQTNR